MSELLNRAGGLFLAPAPARDLARPAVAPPPARMVGVLASARDLPAVAGAVAAGLRRAHRAKAVLVLLPGDLALAAPAFHASRALARRLGERDLAAVPAGATVRAPLRDEAAAWRTISASAVPVVVALSARSDEHDGLLAQADELRLAADDAVADLALASLAALGPPAALVAPPVGFASRRLAALGLIDLRAAPEGVSA